MVRRTGLQTRPDGSGEPSYLEPPPEPVRTAQESRPTSNRHPSPSGRLRRAVLPRTATRARPDGSGEPSYLEPPPELNPLRPDPQGAGIACRAGPIRIGAD